MITTQPAASLERRLGPLDAAAIVFSNVIGGGIFVLQRSRGHDTVGGGGSGRLLVGYGLDAAAMQELAAMRPRAGGEYVYLRDAFGPLTGFLSGWTSFVAGFSGAIAASAVALADYVGRFIPAAGNPAALVTIPIPIVPLIISPRNLVALLAIALLTVAHVRGLGVGRSVQNLLAGAKVLALVLFLAAGFAFGHGESAGVAAPTGVAPVGWLLALIPVMYAYSGWNAASYVAEEVRSPGRNVPLALGLGTLTVVTIYLGLNGLYLVRARQQRTCRRQGDAHRHGRRTAVRICGG